MKERLDKLLTIKSIVTLLLTIVFCGLSAAGVISGEQFLTIFTVVIGFYFGTQAERKKNAQTDERSEINESVQTDIH